MGLMSWIRASFAERPGADRPIVSLVVLLRRPRRLDGLDVWGAVGRAVGVEAEVEVAPVAAGSFVVWLGPKPLLVNSLAEPYVADPEAIAGSIVELRLRQALATHRAWLSVDWLGDVEDDSAYPTIGRVLAELIDEDGLLLLEPSLGRIVVYEPALDALLRGPGPLAAFDHPTRVPVVALADDDPGLSAAVVESRRRWPQFVSAFAERRASQSFAVKARLVEGEAVEHVWVAVETIEHGRVLGRLDNEPITLSTARFGDRVRFPIAAVSDWLYDDGPSVHGGFTLGPWHVAARRT